MKIKFGFIISIFSSIFYLSSFVGANNIGFIDAKFCNENKLSDELNVITKAGVKSDICIQFTNSFSTDLSVNLNFVDVVVTSDVSQNRACSTSRDFVRNLINNESLIVIPSGSTIQKIFKIKFPVGFQGFDYGCLTYQLANATDNINIDNSMFDVIVRKAKFVSFYVGDVPVDNNIVFDGFFKNTDKENNLTMGFSLANKGNVDQSIDIGGSVSNFWGYRKVFSGLIVLGAGEKKNFDTNSLGAEIILPSYGGLYQISLNIKHIPKFSFDIRNPDKNLTQEVIIIRNLYIFLFSWQICVGLAFVISLIGFLVYKKETRT